MKKGVAIKQSFAVLLVLIGAGCESQDGKLSGNTGGDLRALSVYSSYTPVKIDILPLTGLVSHGGGQGAPKIKVFVSLLDVYGSQQKTPAVFRFELYEHVQRSVESKGSRNFIWPDIDLTNADRNNRCWRDFLRAYEFELDLEAPISQDCIVLHVTALCPNGRRLSAELELKCSK